VSTQMKEIKKVQQPREP